MYDYWLIDEERLIYVIMEYIDDVSFGKLKFRNVGPGMMFNRFYLTLSPLVP